MSEISLRNQFGLNLNLHPKPFWKKPGKLNLREKKHVSSPGIFSPVCIHLTEDIFKEN
jgi:hypothetical protein